MRFASITSGMLVLAATLARLFVVYPWSTYYGNFYFGWWTTMWSYLLVAAAMAVVAAAVTGLCLQRGRSWIASGVAYTAVNLAVGGLAAVALGTMGLGLPGTRIRGIFFAEWKFVTFFCLVTVPVSLLGGILCAILVVRRSRERPGRIVVGAQQHG